MDPIISPLDCSSYLPIVESYQIKIQDALINSNFRCMVNDFTGPGGRITKQRVSPVSSLWGTMVGGHGGWSWVVTLPVSLLFEERLMVTYCYGLQVDGVFGLVRIMSSFKPCPPFLRSPSEMGSLPSWSQLPFQLAVPCGLMATRHPWAPALLCATL